VSSIVDKSYGAIVQGNNVVSFLEIKLSEIGLNSSEQNDFITYWASRMVAMDHVYIYFVVGEEYDSIAELNVTPNPDSELRVFMIFQDYSDMLWDEFEIIPQNFTTFERNGFILVEGGGAEIASNTTP